MTARHDCNLTKEACRLRHTASVDPAGRIRPFERVNQGGVPFCFIVMKPHLDTSDFDFLTPVSLGHWG